MEMVFMALFMGFAAIIWVGVVAFGFLTYSWIKDLLKENK